MMFQYHPKQWHLLQRMVKNKRLPHALLFSGPKDLGKHQVALEFAKQLMCPAKQGGSACGQCLSCKLIEKRQHPDLILIEPQKNQIQIEQIRDIQQALSLTPRYVDFKCCILNEAHLMNQSSQNAFLKLLEETPRRARIILVSSQPNRLFATIRSRIQTLKFYPLSQEMLKSIEPRLTKAEAGDWAQLAWGRPRRAQRFLADPKALDKEKQRLVFARQFLNVLPAQRMAYLDQLFKKKKDNFNPHNFLDVLLNYQRICLLQCLKAVPRKSIASWLQAPKDTNPNQAQKIKNTINKILKLKVLLQITNIEPRLALENLMVNI